MKKTITITISRQFGSNGREIGRKLAEYLDIGYYNKEIMEKIAKDMGVSSDFFNEDNQNEDGLYSISNRKLRSFGSIAELSVNSQVFERATDLICGIAQRESSVIVGRCADYIFRDHRNVLNIYIYAKYAPGDPDSKQIMIDSSMLGVRGTAEVLAEIVQRRFGL